VELITTIAVFLGAMNHSSNLSLVERRIRDAAAMGCRRLIVETAEDTPQHSAPSYRNMLRFGFVEAYKRANFIYKKAVKSTY